MGYKIPHLEEINLMKIKAQQFGKNGQMVPVDLWDGECWKTMFEFLKLIAKDNEDLAWEYLAHFIHSLEEDDDE